MVDPVIPEAPVGPELAGFATLARRLERLSPRSGRTTTDLLLQLEQVDQAVYVAIARTPTPTLDRALRHLSNAANKSRLWVGIAAGLALLGGHRGRRAALGGLLSVGTASFVANVLVKPVAERSRPEREEWEVPTHRHVNMPESRSFPSGHSASAFAFASGVSQELPILAAPMYGLAAAVAYSRTHTGVHFPGDVVIGSLLGIATGQTGPIALQAADKRRLDRATRKLA
jgi:membrane-associated phospholipid phosphatase